MSEHDWHRLMEDSPYCDVRTASIPPKYQWTCSKCGEVAYRDYRDGKPPIDGCLGREPRAGDFGIAGIGMTAEVYEERIADLEAERDKLLRCLENDYGIKASWDGLRKVWLTERTYMEPESCAECARGMGRYADSLCDQLKQRIVELERVMNRAAGKWAKADARCHELEQLVRDLCECSMKCSCYNCKYFRIAKSEGATKFCKRIRKRMRKLGIEVE